MESVTSLQEASVALQTVITETFCGLFNHFINTVSAVSQWTNVT